MSSTGVVAALVFAFVGLFAAYAFLKTRRPALKPAKENDRAWDRHARSRASRSPPEPPPGEPKSAPPRGVGGSSDAKPKSASSAARPARDKAKGPPSGNSSKRKSKGGSGAKSASSDKTAPSGAPAPSGKTAPINASLRDLPNLFDDDDPDTDLTIVTLGPLKTDTKLVALAPRDYEEDRDEPEPRQRVSAVPIVYDDEAAVDEPTAVEALILVSATGQTDRGQRRRKNEDSYAVLDSHGLFVVADGMGGHSGGEVASKIAVDVITGTFEKNKFPGALYPGVPRRGSELAFAIQMANEAIYERARSDPHLAGMGTTVVSARFSPNKQRVYIGHVGDSRCYRLREAELRQITTDHTMGAVGLTGPLADRLERAVGIGPLVKVDVILARPLPEDLYLLCSDGLSKMVSSDGIRDVLLSEPRLDTAAAKLIERANASGGKDNITVVLVKVTSPGSLMKALRS